MHQLHTGPRARITAPATVEALVPDDTDSQTLRVHFLAYHPKLPHEQPSRF